MKIAFELEDLKKDMEKRREKIGDFAFFQGDLGFRERRIYIRERGRKRGAFFSWKGGEEILFGKARSNEKRVIAAKDCPGMILATLGILTHT